MDYFEELERIEREYEKLSEEYVKLYIQRENKKEEDEELDLKLKVSNDKSNSFYDKLSELRLKIVNASELNFEMMGSAFANVITVFEGERYEFYSSYVNVLRGNEEEYETMYFVAPCTLNKSGLTREFLINSKDILILHNVNYKKTIRFIDFLRNRRLQVTYCGRFDYLEDFIKYVVNYKLNNNVEITINNIEEIMDEFVDLKSDEINKRKNEREKQRKLTLN